MARPRPRVTHELRALQQELERAGFVYTRSRTGHIKYRHPATGKTFIMHGSTPHGISIQKAWADWRRMQRAMLEEAAKRRAEDAMEIIRWGALGC